MNIGGKIIPPRPPWKHIHDCPAVRVDHDRLGRIALVYTEHRNAVSGEGFDILPRHTARHRSLGAGLQV